MQSKNEKLRISSIFSSSPSAWCRQRLAICLLLWCQTAFGQQGQTEDSIAVFRGAEDQTMVLAKKDLIDQCSNNLSQLYKAERLYAIDFNGQFPKAWAMMRFYISSPSFLICPLSPYQPSDTNWDQFDFAQASYTAPEFDGSHPNYTNTTCLYDDSHLLCDGRVIVKHPYALFPAAHDAELFTSYSVAGYPSKARQVVQCLANLRQLAICASGYAMDNADTPAQSFEDLLAYGLADRPDWLICPASGLAGGDYLMEPITKYSDPNAAFIRCLHHGTHVNADLSTVVDATVWESPALIRGSPISRTVNPGAGITLQVASDYPDASLSFQWRKEVPFDATGGPFTNALSLYGATNASLMLANCQSANEGYYSVVVSHSSGITATSAMAFLRVEPLTNITRRYDWKALSCSNNLHQIFAAWQEFNKVAPAGILLYATSLDDPMRLFCPSDSKRIVPDHWSSIGFSNITYSIAEGFSGSSNAMLASCPIHGFAVYGSGAVMAPPVITSVVRDSTNLIIAGTNGFPGGGYNMLVGTNLGLQSADWISVATNQFQSNGCFSATNAMVFGTNQQFYILRLK
jgi:hypothetical protein